eukprot:5384754-Amphidinium_carterae.1
MMLGASGPSTSLAFVDCGSGSSSARRAHHINAELSSLHAFATMCSAGILPMRNTMAPIPLANVVDSLQAMRLYCTLWTRAMNPWSPVGSVSSRPCVKKPANTNLERFVRPMPDLAKHIEHVPSDLQGMRMFRSSVLCAKALEGPP